MVLNDNEDISRPGKSKTCWSGSNRSKNVETVGEYVKIAFENVVTFVDGNNNWDSLNEQNILQI